MTLDEARKVFPPMWTIYEKPADYPDNWVVRMWFGEVPDPLAGVCDSLEHARALIRRSGGSVPLHRSPGDAASIVETWL
jgi:hypothetical protein